MKIFKTLAIAAVALGAAAIATPAQAHDHHHWDQGRHWDHGRNWGHHYYGYYGGPRYYSPYYYDDYYAPSYSYYRPYPYSYGPGITFAFGGHHGYYGHHHWRR